MKKMQKEWMNTQNEHDLNTKSAIAFGGTFAFFTNAQGLTKNAKEPPSQRTKDTANNEQFSNDRQKASL